MTVYYIDPAAGDDSNTGLSWAQAWKTLRGLRVAAVVPGAGDEIRFAKSQTYSPTMGDFSRQSGSSYPLWYIRGAVVFDAFGDSLGPGAFSAGWQPSGTAVQPRRALSHYNGVVTVDVPADAYVWDSHYSHVHATAYAGEYNATGTLLFGVNLGNLSSASATDVHRISGAVRCHVPYTGAGDGDLPAGSITLEVYRDAALVATMPLPAIRNSSTIWTPYSLEIPTLAATSTTNLHIRVTRTGAALTRDTSPFGLEFTEFSLEKLGGIGSTHTVMTSVRNAATIGSGGTTSEIAGNTAVKVFYEVLNPIDVHDQSNACTVAAFGADRLPLTASGHLQCYRVLDVHLTGTHSLSPAGSAGAYDLNGSLGGSEVSPLLLTGGWNTGTDTVDGSTVFSAGITHKLAFGFALLDLQQANHVRLENIGGAYGFGSLFTRARTVYLKGCLLPWSLAPSFGEVTADTNVTLEDMYLGPLMLDGFGTMGNLSLKNTVGGGGFGNTLATRYCEVNSLSLYDSHVRDSYTLHVRGDAVLEQCSLVRPPKLISTAFGHTLTFKNHKPAVSSGAVLVRLIPTASYSRWELIDYQDTSHPTYNFVTIAATGATCDAKITFKDSSVPWDSGLIYPSGLRGNSAAHIYSDGINDFSGTGGGGSSEGSERGYTYGHIMGTRPTNSSLERPFDMGGMGDVMTPPWNYHSVSGAPRVVVQSPDAAASGRVFLVKRFANISYRSPEQLFLMTGRTPQYTGGTTWMTLKAIYVPRAGDYRAHFGLMKENLQFDFSFGGALSGFISVPLTMPIPSNPVASGVRLGGLGVYSNAMDGGSKTQDLYASTADEAASGSGNQNLDEWHDVYLDFSTVAGGLVELRLGTGNGGAYPTALFDVLRVYERP